MQESDILHSIHTKLNLIAPIPFDQFLEIKNFSKLVKFYPGELFIKPGSPSNKIAFVLEGLLKTYYLNKNGKEYITHLASEGSFVGNYTDLLSNNETTGFVEAITECWVYYTDYSQIVSLAKKHHSWSFLLWKITEKQYLEQSFYERYIMRKTAVEKLNYFKNQFPKLFEQFPLNQIALYLDITPATLSRLKNNSGRYKEKSTEV